MSGENFQQSVKLIRKLGRLVFVRHGESIWNREPVRFTGWADIPLTERGRLQAKAAGKVLTTFELKPHAVFTSLLKRSKDTFDEIALLDSHYSKIPIINSWRLNERHYGALVGLSKEEAGDKLGHEQVMLWRRSWHAAPPKMDPREMTEWKNAIWAKPTTIISEPGKGKNIATEKNVVVPESESLQDCANRTLPLWQHGIAPRLARGETVLVVAHANSIRAMIKHIDMDTMNEEQIKGVSIPSAVPLVYDFAEFTTPSEIDPLAGIVQPKKLSMKPYGMASSLGMRGRYIATRDLIQVNMKTVYNVADENKTQLGKFDEIVYQGIYELEDVLDNNEGFSVSGNINKDALIVTDGHGIIVHKHEAKDVLDYQFEAIDRLKNKVLLPVHDWINANPRAVDEEYKPPGKVKKFESLMY